MDDLEITTNADVQKRLLTVVKYFCVPHLILKCINDKSLELTERVLMSALLCDLE